ncbi:MAG: response regulator [Myxococcota bacterium]
MTWRSDVIRILVVEDDPADQELLRLAIDHNQVAAELVLCLTAEAALHRLRSPPMPDLVLLDLRLPDMDGLELLDKIKQSPEWSSLPVIILSNSTNADDVAKGYARHAAAYLLKPSSLEDWHGLVRSFTDYWLRALLPRP